MDMDKVNARILEGLPGGERLSFIRGLKALGMSDPSGRIALRKSFKASHPEWTEAQLDIAVSGEAPREKSDWL